MAALSHRGCSAQPLQVSPVAPLRYFAATLAPSSPCPHSGQVAICGLGWVNIKTSELQNDAAAAKVLAAEQRRSQELVRRLALDTSPFSQAVSLIVQSAAEIEAQRPLTNLNSEICVGSTCPEDIMRADVMAPLTDELARRAVYSSDPRLYGLAFKMCRLFVSVPACSSLNV